MQFIGKFPGYGFSLKVTFQGLQKETFEQEVSDSFRPKFLKKRNASKWSYPDPRRETHQHCCWRYNIDGSESQISMILESSPNAKALEEACAYSLDTFNRFQKFYNSNELIFVDDGASLIGSEELDKNALKVILGPTAKIQFSNDLYEHWVTPVGEYRISISNSETLSVFGADPEE